MREQPTVRIPFGILALLAALAGYGIAVATFVPPFISNWHTLFQAGVYLLLGVVWLLPLRWFLIWMETGRWG